MRLFSNGWRLLVIGGLLALLGACGNDNNGEVRLLRLEIAPATQTIAAGTTTQLRATGVYSDGNSFDVTEQAQWQSANTNSVAVSNNGGSKGLVTGSSPSSGPVTVTATLDEATAASAVTVTAATVRLIQVSPDSGPLPRGLTRQLTATAVYTDNSSQDITSTATWVSSDTSAATVGNVGGAGGNKGLVTGVGPNSSLTTISATSGGVTGSLPVRISAAAITSIQVTPPTLGIAWGGYQKQFTATGVFSDGTTGDITTQVVWSASAATATISNAAGEKGLLTTSNTAGATQITATAGSITSPAATVSVNDARLTSIEIDASNKPFAPATSVRAGLGRTLQFTATGSFSGTATPPLNITNLVRWATTDVTVATISNAEGSNGRSVTQGPGVVNISAALTRGVTPPVSEVSRSIALTVTNAELVSMVVEPSTLTVPRSFKAPLRVVGTFSDSSQEDISADVTWTSQDSNIATVSNTSPARGVVTGGNPGTTLITASQPGSGISATASAVITGATLASISVDPAAATIPQGISKLFKAIAAFSDGSTLDITNYGQTVWTSSDTNTARIVANGEAFGFAQGGGVKIKASRPGSVLEGVADLTVDGVALIELRIIPKTFTGCSAGTFTAPRTVEKVAVGTARLFRVCARFYDGFIGDVTNQASWATQGPGVIAVSNAGTTKGRVTTTGREKEQGVIEATYSENGITKTDTFTVNLVDGTITSITIAASRDLSVQQAPGTGIQFEATAIYRAPDGSTVTDVNITESSAWTTSDDSVVAISNTDGNRGAAVVQTASGGGLLGGAPPSSATIRAARAGVNSNTLTVNRTP